MRAKLIAGLAVAAAGCGGAEESGGTDAKTIAAADWSRQVESLCSKHATRSEREVLKLQKESEGLSREEFVAKVLDRSAELTKPMIDEVAAMPLPQGKEAQAKRFVASMNNLLPMIERMADVVRDGDEAELKKTTGEMQEETVEARAMARDLAIDECIPRNSTG